MSDLERYMRRQELKTKITRWFDDHEFWGWLLVVLLAGLFLAIAMLVKAALDLIGGG